MGKSTYSYSELITRLEGILNESKISGVELGRRIGKNKSAISKIRNGKMGITLDTLVRICYELGTTPNYLVLGEGPKYREKH